MWQGDSVSISKLLMQPLSTLFLHFLLLCLNKGESEPPFSHTPILIILFNTLTGSTFFFHLYYFPYLFHMLQPTKHKMSNVIQI
ncbi:hypothetical protein Lalb_Chr24g0400031 [Lupinus albus]|uniref:Uncharacterized protein n=1 Tax=Lupinus albus TaxID=3870 RepID=A0A6A4NG21_LUPAL|nr:hypothetical protein Lalb_Chr24g0400031 [Lupinus albus]